MVVLLPPQLRFQRRNDILQLRRITSCPLNEQRSLHGTKDEPGLGGGLRQTHPAQRHVKPLRVAIDDGDHQIRFRLEVIVDTRFPDLEGIGDILIAERAAAARLDQSLRALQAGPASLRP
jgi:hypothetical protein